MEHPSRNTDRFSLYDDLRFHYEGWSGEIPVHLPDLSPRGMFINTPLTFPEGAVMAVSFRLPRTGGHIHARGEVRYCIQDTGIGLEFIDLELEQREAIERELSCRVCPYECCRWEEERARSATGEP